MNQQLTQHNPTYTTSYYALTQEQIACIWQQRALQMARVEIVEEPGEQKVVVLVRLGNELFGLDVEFVSDIRPNEALTRVPRVPEWVMGVINLHGRILSVVDLRQYLGLAPAAQPGAGAFVTVKTPAMEVIFFVDEVPGAESLPVRRDLMDAGIRLPAGCTAVVERQAGPGEQPYIAVIDLPALLADPRLVIHEDLV